MNNRVSIFIISFFIFNFYTNSNAQVENIQNEFAELRQIPNSRWEQQIQDKSFIYNYPKPEKPAKTKPPFFSNFNKSDFANIFKKLLFILVGIILIGVFYFIFGNNIFYHSKQRGRRKSKLLNEKNEETTNSELEIALKNALQENNFRLAIRIQYQILLQELSKKNAIQFRQQYTNQVYVTQLQSQSYGNIFRQITSIFEYTWYGHFGVTSLQYQSISSLFHQIYSELE